MDKVFKIFAKHAEDLRSQKVFATTERSLQKTSNASGDACDAFDYFFYLTH